MVKYIQNTVYIPRLRITNICSMPDTIVDNVSTEQKSSQRIGFAQSVVPPWCLAELLCKLPHFLIYNRFVGVLKNQPVLLRIHNRIFVLVGLLVRTEVDRMPHIFGLGENLSNDITTPVIRVGKFLFAFPNAPPCSYLLQ